MKKLLLVVMMIMALAVTASTRLFAEGTEEDECPCGVDEEGQCIPCEEETE